MTRFSVIFSLGMAVVLGAALTASAADLTGTTQTIDFTGFDGSGFAPAPAAGQLDSDDWRVTGFSAGSGTFGGTHTTNDFARGASTGGEVTGGIYAFDIGGGDVALGVQPAGSDFTPGTMELRLTNNTAGNLFGLNFGYDVAVLNDQGRANSFGFSFSQNGNPAVALGSQDFTSPEAADGAPAWVTTARSGRIVFNQPLAPGEFVDLIWTGDDVSGGGSRDEFGLDNVSFAGTESLGSVIAEDNFDGTNTFASRTIMPDNSGNSPPGTFAGSDFDVFGIVDRTVNSDFNSDTPAGKVDSFFGVEDVENGDNPGGTGTATWTANITGATDLTLAVDIWANLGDFESSDTFEFSYSIDGSPAETLLVSSVDDGLEPGQDLLINDIVLDEASFQTFFAAIDGTGDLLTITFDTEQNAAGELFGFDNLQVLGTAAVVPEPASLLIWALLGAIAGIGALRWRRSKR